MSLKIIAKKIKNNLSGIWKAVSVYVSFYKRHKIIAGNLKSGYSKLTEAEKKEYLTFWKRVSPVVSLKTVEITKSLSGVYNKYIVPEEIYALNIEPYLVPRKEVLFFENKSFYNRWFRGDFFPISYIYKMDGEYFDSGHSSITIEYVLNKLERIDYPVVIKPTVDSYGGRNVFFVRDFQEAKSTIELMPSLVIQECIIQSNLINKINDGSINTVRVCLFKPKGHSFEVINSSLRMGVDGSLDNETAGGIVCSISKEGILNNYAVNKAGEKYFKHPNSNYVFEGKSFPLYEELTLASKEVANQIFHTRLVSLDMCLDSEGRWRCIEVNALGQTIRFAQYAGFPFFSEYSESLCLEMLSRKVSSV